MDPVKLVTEEALSPHVRPDHVRNGRLDYRMMKTQTPVSLPLPQPALDIVDRYASCKSMLR